MEKHIKIVNIISSILIILFITKNVIYYMPAFELFRQNYFADIMRMWSIVILCVHVIISVWLFIDSKRNNRLPLMWAAISLFFGLIAVVVYYWRLIYLNMTKFKSNE